MKPDNRVGETKMANCGEIMTIIAYQNREDIDVKFNDGTIREQVSYKEFKKGSIAKVKKNKQIDLQKSRVGEMSIAKNGMKMTIVKYINKHDVDVKFENNMLRKNVTYWNFLTGNIGCEKTLRKNAAEERIGETRLSNNGLIMTITAYRKTTDIDVTFENGVVVKNKTYDKFKKGRIYIIDQTINLNESKINKTNQAKNGCNMTIIKYVNKNNIDIAFDNKMIVKNKTYYNFTIGLIGFPKQYQTIKIGQLAYHVDNKWAFYVKCDQCGLSDIMTYEQMQAHSCCQN